MRAALRSLSHYCNISHCHCSCQKTFSLTRITNLITCLNWRFVDKGGCALTVHQSDRSAVIIQKPSLVLVWTLQNYQPFIRSAVGPTAEADPFAQLLKQSRKYQANISAIGEHIDNDGAIVRYVTCWLCCVCVCGVRLCMVRTKLEPKKLWLRTTYAWWCRWLFFDRHCSRKEVFEWNITALSLLIPVFLLLEISLEFFLPLFLCSLFFIARNHLLHT